MVIPVIFPLRPDRHSHRHRYGHTLLLLRFCQRGLQALPFANPTSWRHLPTNLDYLFLQVMAKETSLFQVLWAHSKAVAQGNIPLSS